MRPGLVNTAGWDGSINSTERLKSSRCLLCLCAQLILLALQLLDGRLRLEQQLSPLVQLGVFPGQQTLHRGDVLWNASH